jgi:8-oxo-dGTP pyrophosphatase MutT (NUDIX family)
VNFVTQYVTEQRAGGVVFRRIADRIEYLLVTSNSNPKRWIIPAGHIETGESAAIAALREVAEEAGVQARILADLQNYQYYWYRNNQKILLDTRLFLMEYEATALPNPEDRRVQFFPYEVLLKLNLWDESKEIIEKAQRILTNMPKKAESKAEP